MRQFVAAMGRVDPPPAEPSNRWPWIAMAGGVVIVVVAAVVIFFVNRPSSSVNINLEGTPTPNPVARAGVASPSPPATLVPPTLQPSASLAPTATPLPVPTATAAPTPAPAPPTPPPSPTPAPPPPTPAPALAVASPSTIASPEPTAPSSPTAFAGQVSAGGGLGNTRSDVDAAYGSPSGETPNNLVVFRKNNFEYHVGLVPDLNGRAALIVQAPIDTAQAPTLQQAQAEAHRLLPRDAQPPNPTAEGNNQYAVERYMSQMLAQALPAAAFSPGGGQPGQFLVVYVKNAAGNISRWILGPGNDPNALIAAGG